MDTTNRKGMEKLYLKRLFILLFLFPASLWAQDALSETPVRSTDTEAINEIVTGLNTVWMLLAAMLVFFMQPGFALVEAGFIRTKNTANVLMKNLIDFMFGSILNGIFAMYEIALVSSSKARLETLVAKGNKSEIGRAHV